MAESLPQPKRGEVYMVMDPKGMVLWPPRKWGPHWVEPAPWESRGDRLVDPPGEIYLLAGETIHVLDVDPTGYATATGTTLDGRRVMFTGLDVLLNGLVSLGEGGKE